MWKILSSARARVTVGLAVVFALALAGIASAAEPVYNIKPVTESITSELTGNLPVILGVIGALIALAVAVRAVRKFVKV